MSSWTAAKCWSCGWTAQRMLLSKAQTKICPNCNKKELHPL